MSDAQHARYLKLLDALYNSRLRPSDFDELNHLHRLNIARVGLIVTGIKEESECTQQLA